MESPVTFWKGESLSKQRSGQNSFIFYTILLYNSGRGAPHFQRYISIEAYTHLEAAQAIPEGGHGALVNHRQAWGIMLTTTVFFY